MAPNKTFYPTSPPLSHRQLKHPHKTKINKIILSASPYSVFHAEHTISELKCKSDSKKKIARSTKHSRVNITAEGKGHLGVVFGSTEYRDEYVKDLVKDWDNQLTILSTIP